MLHLALVLLELLLRFLPLLAVAVFHVFDHLLHIRGLLGLHECILLASDYGICLSQDGLDLLFIGPCERGLNCRILLVLRVKMEDDFSELRNLLAHLMVDVLGWGGCLCHVSLLIFIMLLRLILKQ